MFTSDREFQIWDYNASHKQLLLRSPMTGDETTNVDVVFWGVQHLSLPSVVDGLSVKPATDEEIKAGLVSANNIAGIAFVIQSNTSHGLVVAAGCKVLKNELDIFDSSLVYVDRDRPEEEYGVVLAKS